MAKPAGSLPWAPAGAERRAAPRLRAVDVTTPLGPVLDISSGGLRLVTTHKPGPARQINLSLRAPIGTVDLTCRIAWTRPLDGQRWEMGLQFLELTPAQEAYLHALLRMCIKALVECKDPHQAA